MQGLDYAIRFGDGAWHGVDLLADAPEVTFTKPCDAHLQNVDSRPIQ